MIFLQFLLTITVLLISLAAVALNVFSIPGNWLMFLCAFLLSWFRGWEGPSLFWLAVVLFILALAEVVEFLSSYFGAKSFGASKMASFAAMGGGIFGAILLSFFIPIIGSVIGAIAGSFFAALLIEVFKEKKLSESLWAAIGAALGRTAGMIAKISGGLTAWLLLLFTAWHG